jgi:DNA-binding GntR family transcriptional regulator
MGVSRTPMLSAWDELLNDGPIWAKLRERCVVRPTGPAEHEAILRCVADGEPEAARRAVHAHFDGAIRDFLEMTAGSKHSPALAVRYLLRRRQDDRQFGRGRRSP